MNHTFNILVVGMGGHALSWKAYINAHPGWKLVGVVDTDTENLQPSGGSGGSIQPGNIGEYSCPGGTVRLR